MATEHAPGPWSYIEVIGACSVNARAKQVLSYPYSPDAEDRANARLIAVAPDMLAALQSIHRYGYVNGADHDMVASAIAKATGAPATPPQQAASSAVDASEVEPVAWYVFADTEHWVTLDREEAEKNAADGFQVRPLMFGYTAALTPANVGEEPSDEKRDTLWALHIEGPDDVHPAPSRAIAERAAEVFNAWHARQPQGEGYPVMRAKVIEWPHGIASHALDAPNFVANLITPATEPSSTGDRG